LLLGLLFLALAVASGAYALLGMRRAPQVRVRVQVRDTQGRPLPKALVRTRSGGDWLALAADGTLELLDPATRKDPDVAAALADALEAKAAFHAARSGARPAVLAAGEGRYEATLVLEACGMLRVGVAPSGFASARARIDPDGSAGRWRVVEGHDVVRSGEAATWAVFADAPALWATLEGERGVAQVRIELPAPSPGQLLERSLGPEPALPIRGRVLLPGDERVPSLHGVLEVQELREGKAPLARPSVRIERDGRFALEYVGRGRFQLAARLPFAEAGAPVTALAGAEDVALPARARPWAELGPAALASGARELGVSVFAAESDGLQPAASLLPEEGALPTDAGLCVALPGPGRWRVLLAAPGSDEAPPRSGEVTVEAAGAGPVPATLALADLPHGSVELQAREVPARGGEARLGGRVRTLLPKVGERAAFAHLPVGRQPLHVAWREPGLCDELLDVEVRAGEVTRVTLAPTPGGSLRVDATGTWLAAEPRLALRIVAGASPYGTAEGLVTLLREGTQPVFASSGALRPGTYRARVHPPGDGTRWLEVRAEVRAGERSTVAAREP
ncbi:MAG: hypothetical protein ACKOSS_08440, partial [Planctomycetia bacterium]